MDEVDKIVTGIMKYLKTSGRIELLPKIIDGLEKETTKIKGESVALVTSAYPLKQAQLMQLGKELFHLFGRKLEIVNKVDSTLIGGFVITVADKIIDLTLAGDLDNLEERLQNEKN